MNGELLNREKMCIVIGGLLWGFFYYSFLFLSVENIVIQIKGKDPSQGIIIRYIESLCHSFGISYSLASLLFVLVGGGFIIVAYFSFKKRCGS